MTPYPVPLRRGADPESVKRVRPVPSAPVTDGGGTSTVRRGPEGYRLGVDLGTTYTAVAVEREGRPEIFTLGSRSSSIPSVVFLRDDGLFLAGDAASRRAVAEPNRVAREFKRRVGDPTPILLAGTAHSPESLMARLLSAVLGAVAEREGAFPDRVTVTHPANWGPYKLDLLGKMADIADPGRIGPLRRLRTASEPEAAALAYASTERVEPGEVVAVYDLGGGTFDAAVLAKTATGFELLGPPQGIERLGGIDFDEAIFSFVLRAVDADRSLSVLETLDPDDPTTQSAVARLRQECTEAKEALSSDTEVSIPVVLPDLHTQVRLTRAELEAMIRPAIEQTIDALRRAVELTGAQPEELKAVLLVGGSSRIPLVAEMVSSALGRPVALDVDPKNAVALGAALLAGNDRATDRRPAAAAEAAEPGLLVLDEPKAAAAPAPEAPVAPVPAVPARPATGEKPAESMAEWLSGANGDKPDPLAEWGELPPEPPPPPAPVPAPRRWSRPVGPPAAPTRRRSVVIGAAVVLLVAVVAAVISWSRSDPPTPSPAVYAFSPATLDNGLVVSRTWQLLGERGELLRGEVVLRNPTSSPVNASYDEVIPKSVASTVSAIRFDPVYTSVVQDDPVVRYALDIEPGGQRDLRYETDVAPEGNSLGRLARLAADQIEAEKGRPRVQGEAVQEVASLQELVVEPSRVDLLPGAGFTLKVSGTMSDGTAASAEVLAGVAWSSTNTRVVSVAPGGVLRAGALGAAIVSAQAGGIERQVTVSVIPAHDATVATRRRMENVNDSSPQTPTATTIPPLTLPPPSPTTKPKPPPTTVTSMPATTVTTVPTTTSTTTSTTTIPPTTTTTEATTTSTTAAPTG